MQKQEIQNHSSPTPYLNATGAILWLEECQHDVYGDNDLDGPLPYPVGVSAQYKVASGTVAFLFDLAHCEDIPAILWLLFVRQEEIF